MWDAYFPWVFEYLSIFTQRVSTTSLYMIFTYIICTTLILALSEKRIATFPVLSVGKTDYDYRLAQFVLSQNNSVILKELREYSRSITVPSSWWASCTIWMLSIIYMIYLSTNYTITIESIHRRDAAPLSRMDALEFNDDNNDKGDHVARSLEVEIDDKWMRV